MPNTNRTHSSQNSRSRRPNTPTIDPPPPAAAAGDHPPPVQSNRQTSRNHPSQTSTPEPETNPRSQFAVGERSHHSTHAHSTHTSPHGSAHAPSSHASRQPSPHPLPPALRGQRGNNKRRLPDNERVPKSVWYFAGGVGKPPTGAQMREWKRRDRERRARREEARAEGGGFGLLQRFGGFLKRNLFGPTGGQ